MTRFTLKSPIGGLALLLALGLAPGCGGAPPVPTAEEQAARRAQDRESVMQADRDFNDATAREGIEGWVRHFAPDGRQIGPGEMPTGHDAIRAYMGPFFDGTRRLTWDPDHAEVSDDGTMGWTTGRYTSALIDSNGVETPRGKGRYVSIWRREAGGPWRLVCDLGNPDPPPAAE